MDAEKNIHALIINHRRRLQKLKEKQARRGEDTPVDILLEIEDIEESIKELEATLASLKNAPQTAFTKSASTQTIEYLKVKITLEGNYDTYDLETAIRSFAAIMQMSPDDIEFEASPGSIVLILRVPSEAVEHLRYRLETNSAQLRLLQVTSVIFETETGNMEKWVSENREFKLTSITSTISKTFEDSPIPPTPPTLSTLPTPPTEETSPPGNNKQESGPYLPIDSDESETSERKLSCLQILLIILLVVAIIIFSIFLCPLLSPILGTSLEGFGLPPLNSNLSSLIIGPPPSPQPPRSELVEMRHLTPNEQASRCCIAAPRLTATLNESYLIRTRHTGPQNLQAIEVRLNQQPLTSEGEKFAIFPRSQVEVRLCQWTRGIGAARLYPALRENWACAENRRVLPQEAIPISWITQDEDLALIWRGATPGTYRLEIVAIDVDGNRGNTITQHIKVAAP